MGNRLQNKVAIITGAGTGIGKAIALAFASEGANIVGVARRLGNLESMRQDIENYGKIFTAIKCDITRKKDCDNVVQETLYSLKRVDILVNNAAVFPLANFLEITQEQWDTVLAIDLRGAVFMSQAVLPNMVANKSGNIIMMNSSVTRRFPNNLPQAHYIVAKMGLLGLTRCLAAEFGPQGIRVNGIAPGYTPETEGALKYIEPMLGGTPGIRKEAPTVPLRRYGTVNDYTATAIFLVSDESAYITGQTISVDGGATMQA